ncbi:MAG: hypothetical protein Q8R08_03170 [bacterium]|nr:hypothetical protein [bacterium]
MRKTWIAVTAAALLGGCAVRESKTAFAPVPVREVEPIYLDLGFYTYNVDDPQQFNLGYYGYARVFYNNFLDALAEKTKPPVVTLEDGRKVILTGTWHVKVILAWGWQTNTTSEKSNAYQLVLQTTRHAPGVEADKCASDEEKYSTGKRISIDSEPRADAETGATQTVRLLAKLLAAK